MAERHRACLLLAVAAVFLLVAPLALAQGGYNLSWWTVDGGGQTFSTGGGYTLGGTAGQPDAHTLAGGDYVLAGGFWCVGAGTAGHDVYLPLVRRSR